MGLPGRAQRPGTPPGGGTERRRQRPPWPAGLGFSGGLPGRAPGRTEGRSPLQARLAARRLARPGERRGHPAARSQSGPWGQAGTAPPARRFGHCSTALAAPPRPPPAPRNPIPARPWRTDPSAAAARAHPAACAPGARGCAPGLHTRESGATRQPPARPLPASRPARPLAQPFPGAHLPPAFRELDGASRASGSLGQWPETAGIRNIVSG